MAGDALGRRAPGGPGAPRDPAPGRPGRRGRLILAGLILLPVGELALLIEVGRLVGPVWVLLGLLAGVLLGGLVIRRAGGSAWRRTRDRLERGLTPSREAADTTVILLAGLLLVLPGFLTDLAAVLLLVPVTRRVVRRPLERALSRAVVMMPRNDGDVVRGEIVD